MSVSPSNQMLLGKIKATFPKLGLCYQNLRIFEYVSKGSDFLVFQDLNSTREAKDRMTFVSNYLLKFSIFECIISDQIIHKLSIESAWSASLEILQGFEARTLEKITMYENAVADGLRELHEIASMKEQNINREFTDQVLGNLLMDIHRRDQSLNHLNATKEYEIIKTIKECEANGKVIAGRKNIECLQEQLTLVRSEISNSIDSSLNNFKNELTSLINDKENLRSMGNPLENLRNSHIETLQQSMLKLTSCFDHFIWADCLNNDLTSKLDASEKIIENNINIEEAKKNLSICVTAEPYILAELSHINEEIFKIESAYRAYATSDRCDHYGTVLAATNKNVISLQKDLQSLKVKTTLNLNTKKNGDFITDINLKVKAKPKITCSSLEIIDPDAAPLSGKTLELKTQLDILVGHKINLENQIARRIFYENQLRDFMAKEEEIKRQREATSNALREKNEKIKRNYQILLNIENIQGLKFKSEVMTLLVIIFFKNFSVSRKPGACSGSKSLFETSEISANDFYKEITKSKDIKVSCCGDPFKAVHECDSFTIEDTIKLILEAKVLMGLKDTSRRNQTTSRENESYVDSMFYCLRDSITLTVFQKQIELDIDSKAAIKQMKDWENEGISLMKTLNYRNIAKDMELSRFPHK